MTEKTPSLRGAFCAMKQSFVIQQNKDLLQYSNNET